MLKHQAPREGQYQPQGMLVQVVHTLPPPSLKLLTDPNLRWRPAPATRGTPLLPALGPHHGRRDALRTARGTVAGRWCFIFQSRLLNGACVFQMVDSSPW